MSSSILRLSFTALTALIAFSTIASGQTTDNPKKKKEVVQDPFAEIPTDPIPLTPPAEDPSKKNPPEEINDPFQLVGEPVERIAERPIKDPFELVQDDDAIQILPLDDEDTIPKDQAQPDQQAGSILKTATDSEAPVQASFEEKFWEYLTSNAYKNWAPAPGQNADFYPGRSPHGDFLKMYLNRTAAAAPEELPNGSIIVKENYAADRETLAAITVMYRSKGYNADAGDWYWVKYNPDGTVATAATQNGPQKIMGKPNSCIECHGGAADDDFTFFNDK